MKILNFVLEHLSAIITGIIIVLAVIGMRKLAYWLMGISLFVQWVLMYAGYRLMILSGIILGSAGRMKTGNDLEEQVKKTLKEAKIPSFCQFYWRLYIKSKEHEQDFSKIFDDEKEDKDE